LNAFAPLVALARGRRWTDGAGRASRSGDVFAARRIRSWRDRRTTGAGIRNRTGKPPRRSSASISGHAALWTCPIHLLVQKHRVGRIACCPHGGVQAGPQLAMSARQSRRRLELTAPSSAAGPPVTPD
jgi:hypothetical protein